MASLQPRSPGSNSLCRPGPSTNASNSITSEYRVVSDTQHREASNYSKSWHDTDSRSQTDELAHPSEARTAALQPEAVLLSSIGSQLMRDAGEH